VIVLKIKILGMIKTSLQVKYFVEGIFDLERFSRQKGCIFRTWAQYIESIFRVAWGFIACFSRLKWSESVLGYLLRHYLDLPTITGCNLQILFQRKYCLWMPYLLWGSFKATLVIAILKMSLSDIQEKRNKSENCLLWIEKWRQDVKKSISVRRSYFRAQKKAVKQIKSANIEMSYARKATQIASHPLKDHFSDCWWCL